MPDSPGLHGANPHSFQGKPLCQRCHQGATANFSAAWLSHYEPSWKKAPMVYGVKVFYAVLIPFMIGGLVLQILLHLWRVVVNR